MPFAKRTNHAPATSSTALDENPHVLGVTALALIVRFAVRNAAVVFVFVVVIVVSFVAAAWTLSLLLDVVAPLKEIAVPLRPFCA